MQKCCQYRNILTYFATPKLFENLHNYFNILFINILKQGQIFFPYLNYMQFNNIKKTHAKNDNKLDFIYKTRTNY